MKKTDHDLAHDFDGLVRPSQVFEHPKDVLSDPDLSLNEKRAILASWASDACAVGGARLTQDARRPCRVIRRDHGCDALPG